MTNIEIYKRLLDVLKEDLTDPALEIDLSNSQFEIIAEIMTDEFKCILVEERQFLLESIETVFHKD